MSDPNVMASMQFFKDDLFTVGKSHAAYQQYWIANRERLPDSLLRINGGMLPYDFVGHSDEIVYLHDARIQSVEVNLPDVTFHLHGDHHGALREIFLRYTGVRRISPIPDILLSDTGKSDLMCHEITLSNHNYLNHKMLFASSDILSLDFMALDVRLVDHPMPEPRPKFSRK